MELVSIAIVGNFVLQSFWFWWSYGIHKRKHFTDTNTENNMTKQKINEQVVDLTEINRQQAEYILDLEMELAELTDKWKYLKEEIDEITKENQIRKEVNAD